MVEVWYGVVVWVLDLCLDELDFIVELMGNIEFLVVFIVVRLNEGRVVCVNIGDVVIFFCVKFDMVIVWLCIGWLSSGCGLCVIWCVCWSNRCVEVGEGKGCDFVFVVGISEGDF